METITGRQTLDLRGDGDDLHRDFKPEADGTYRHAVSQSRYRVKLVELEPVQERRRHLSFRQELDALLQKWGLLT